MRCFCVATGLPGVLVGVRELGDRGGRRVGMGVPGLDLGCEGERRGEVLRCRLGDHRALGDYMGVLLAAVSMRASDAGM